MFRRAFSRKPGGRVVFRFAESVVAVPVIRPLYPPFLLAADAYGVVTAHERLKGRRASQPEMVGDHHRQLQVHQFDPRAYLRGARNVFVGDIRFGAFVREIEPRLQVERIPARQQDPVGYSHVETRPRVGDFFPFQVVARHIRQAVTGPYAEDIRAVLLRRGDRGEDQ